MIKVPKQAKLNAKKALKKRLSFKNPPMTIKGINSAKEISTGMIKKSNEGKIFSFLSRTIAAQEKNPTPRRKTAINGWGGKSMFNFLKTRARNRAKKA